MGHSTFLLLRCFCMNFVGFLLEVLGPWGINQWEAELAGAQASRVGSLSEPQDTHLGQGSSHLGCAQWLLP